MCALILILSRHVGIFKTTLVPNAIYNMLKIPVAAFFQLYKVALAPIRHLLISDD